MKFCLRSYSVAEEEDPPLDSSFSESVYTKVLNQTDYSKLPKTSGDFVFKDLNSETQYLQVKNFSANTQMRKKSEQFQDSIKLLLNAPNLILDLRNNSGGARSLANGYLKILSQYIKRGKVYVLLNNQTMSQGEIFTLRLKRFKNVKTLGQTTKGILSYGSNYGKREKLPSQLFEVSVTDMGGRIQLLQYENYGLNPNYAIGN